MELANTFRTDIIGLVDTLESGLKNYLENLLHTSAHNYKRAEEYQRLYTNLLNIQSEYNSLQEEHGQCSMTISEHLDTIQNLKDENAELNNRLASSESTISQLTSELEASHVEVKDITEQLVEKDEHIRVSNEKIAQLTDELEKEKKRVSKLKDDAKSFKDVSILKGLDKEIDNLRKEKEVLQTQIEHWKKTAEAHKEESKRVSKEHEQLVNEHKSLQKQLTELQTMKTTVVEPAVIPKEEPVVVEKQEPVMIQKEEPVSSIEQQPKQEEKKKKKKKPKYDVIEIEDVQYYLDGTNDILEMDSERVVGKLLDDGTCEFYE
jgi:chromosome segregation ATPase